MRLRLRIIFLVALLFISLPFLAQSKDSISLWEWKGEAMVNAGSGTFAPHYISALRHGKILEADGGILNAGIFHNIEDKKRFSWGVGLELLGGITSGADYLKWDQNGQTFRHRIRPSSFRLHQLYAIVKYRSIFIEAGAKEHESFLLDNSLTSGDLTESGNARPIPQIRGGFVNFQNIPLTKGWLQIQGELAVGKFTDNSWLEDFYSRGSSHINTKALFFYRRLYFRTNPSKTATVTVGLQAAGQLGGTTRYYSRGVMIKEEHEGLNFGKVLKFIVPLGGAKSGPGEYYDGNNLGSWDILLRYKLPWNFDNIKIYLQKPWEKGSSLGWKNGFDGLWGIQYDFGKSVFPIKGVLLEYIDFMNQSGPFHYAPHDYPGSTITSNISGGDQYYNNYAYNSYSYYGQSIGTPFLRAPVYNLDGYPQFVDNRVRGFHLAVKGIIASRCEWKVALSHKKGYGDGRQPRSVPVHETSWLAEMKVNLSVKRRLELKAQIAGDYGKMAGNNTGAALTLCYKGSL